ncbi:MAG: hypothetical protein JSW52_08190 [Candidatus Coatesbacteria bacterium]|nr:MAG: hypothetical protein JSW52_08190 [Candidatus Coatesbacteria bacterium]
MGKTVKATSIKETRANGGIVEQVPEPAWLFYILSFIVPIAGIVIGVIYLTKTDEELKTFGKTCLIIAAIPIVLFLLYILVVIIVYVLVIFMAFAFYFLVILLIIITALATAVSPAASVVGSLLLPAIL